MNLDDKASILAGFPFQVTGAEGYGMDDKRLKIDRMLAIPVIDHNKTVLAKDILEGRCDDVTIEIVEELKKHGQLPHDYEIKTIEDSKERYAEALKVLGLLLPNRETKKRVTEIRDFYLFYRYLKLIGVHPPYKRNHPETPLSKNQAVHYLSYDCDKTPRAIINCLKRGKAAMLKRDKETLQNDPSIDETAKKRLTDNSWLNGCLPPDWPTT